MTKNKPKSNEPGNHVSGNQQLVSVLINSAYYLLSHCILVCDIDNESYRLVTLSGRQTKLYDRTYGSTRSAHIAFGKRFEAVIPNTAQEWTPIYPVDNGWLNSICNPPEVTL